MTFPPTPKDYTFLHKLRKYMNIFWYLLKLLQLILFPPVILSIRWPKTWRTFLIPVCVCIVAVFYSQLYSLKVMASHQVVQALVRDEGTVVQLQHGQVLTGAGRHAQVPDSLVCDQLAVREGERLQTRTVSSQLWYGGVCDQDTFLQVHTLQPVTWPGQGLIHNTLLLTDTNNRFRW